MDLDAYRAESLATWDEMAPGWEARREWLMERTRPVNEWLLEKADPKPGQCLLELAAGTGDLGFALAERVGTQGRVITSDFSAEMLAVARRNGEARGLTNVEYRVLDAERLDLEARSIDGAVCRFGYMLMADPGAALGQTKRVLRDGASLAFAVFTTADRNPWAAVPAMTLVQRGHVPPPQPGAPGIFALGDPSRIRGLVADAGLAEQELDEITLEFSYSDFDDLWDTLVRMAGQLARAVNALSADEREATRAAIAENVAQFRNEDGSYTAPASVWGVLAR